MKQININVNGKKVLVRCDFNVPLKDGVITDENRLNGALPTIKYLIKNGAKVILCSHLGKPKGEAKPELSLAPVAKRLSEMLNKEVVFAADDNVVGENAKAAIEKMENGDVVLLQNTRYRKEETKNKENFSKELASLADVYVNAFDFKILFIESINNKTGIFKWDNGDLYFITKDGVEQDFIYAHFQKRNMEMHIHSNEYDKFIIVPNKFIDYCKIDINFVNENSNYNKACENYYKKRINT